MTLVSLLLFVLGELICPILLQKNLCRICITILLGDFEYANCLLCCIAPMNGRWNQLVLHFCYVERLFYVIAAFVI